jgi:hypothetical protein
MGSIKFWLGQCNIQHVDESRDATTPWHYDTVEDRPLACCVVKLESGGCSAESVSGGGEVVLAFCRLEEIADAPDLLP